MKKILAVALVVVILGSVTAFAMGPMGQGLSQGGQLVQAKEETQLSLQRKGQGLGGSGIQFSETVLDELDISQEEYQDALEDGLTLKDLAEEKGLLEEFYQLLLDKHEERLDFMVENERLTQEEADEILEAYEENISDGECDGLGINIRENFGTRSGNEEGYGHRNEAPGQGLRQGGHRGSGQGTGECIYQ